MASMEPLYEKFGGLDAVARIVFGFYDRVLKSPELQPYFADVDMRRLIGHQTKFLAQVLGGPEAYTNAHLREVHARLEIDHNAFDRMIAVLGETLDQFGLSEDDVDFVLTDLRARRPYIVSTAEVDA
jgi:hemoglobin